MFIKDLGIRTSNIISFNVDGFNLYSGDGSLFSIIEDKKIIIGACYLVLVSKEVHIRNGMVFSYKLRSTDMETFWIIADRFNKGDFKIHERKFDPDKGIGIFRDSIRERLKELGL